MKKRQILIIILFCYSFLSIAQVKPYKEIKFKNLNPIWIYSSIDSTLIGNNTHSGRDHFYNLSDNPFPYLINDNCIYIANHTQFSTGEVEGALLEKINLKNGKVLWQQKWDTRNNDRQEWVEYIYLDEDGYINVVTDKRIKEPFNDIFNLFSFKGDTCLINIRKFDPKDGELLENKGGTIEDFESLRIKNSPLGTTILFPNNNNFQYYSMSKSYETISLYNINEIGHIISDVIIDTIQFENNINIYDEGMQFYRRMLKVNKDTLVTLDILNNPLKSEIDSQTIITILNKKMESINKFRVDSLLPYNYEKLYLNFANNKYICVSGQKQNQSYRDTFFYVIFNYQGKIERQFTGIYNNKNHSFWEASYLASEDEFLLPTASSQYYALDFVFTTPFDSVKLHKEFYYTDNDYRFIPIFLLQLENGDIFSYGYTSYYDENNSIFIALSPTMMRIKAEDLGLITSNTNIPSVEKGQFNLYPNPVNKALNVKFEILFSGTLEIIDEFGKTIFEQNLKNIRKKSIDVTTLKIGTYFIRAINKNQKYKSLIKSFVVQ